MPAQRPWTRQTSWLLLAVGVLLAVIGFSSVMAMPYLDWHEARQSELVATYTAYQDTGVLLVKPTGSGSNYTQAPAPGEWSAAAWDDDPGAYLVASLMSHVTGSPSPHPGLKLAMAVLVALPLLVLPIAVARVFRRARAGYAMLLLPPILWVTNGGTVLAGTEYGLSDSVATVRVYALYGLAASMLFLSLTLLLLASSFRWRIPALIGLTLLFGVLAGVGNLLRSYSGVGVAIAVAVLWWVSVKRKRALFALLGAGLALVVATGVVSTSMSLINAERVALTGQSLDELPDSHGTWHAMYLGLSFPQPLNGQPSRFGVEWSDAFGWDCAWAQDPSVGIATEEYDLLLKNCFFNAVEGRTGDLLGLYFEKALFVIKHFGAMIVFIVVGVGLALLRRGWHRRPLLVALAVPVPALILGFVPVVLVMPMLYYYSELSAALGLLLAIALGSLVWAATSLPGHIRSAERLRLSGRALNAPTTAVEAGISVVVPTRNGAEVIADTLNRLGAELSSGDEIVVVENGSTDDTGDRLRALSATWGHSAELVVRTSAPGLGNALREGVLSSRKQRLLLTADDLPFGFSDIRSFEQLSPQPTVAIGSKAHVDSDVQRSRRRELQSKAFRFLRAALLQSRVGDSQGTFWADGAWAKEFAAVSHETGLMWTTELVLAAEQEGLSVVEVPVVLEASHHHVTSRFRFRDAWMSFIGFLRLAIYKDDYVLGFAEPTAAPIKPIAAAG